MTTIPTTAHAANAAPVAHGAQQRFHSSVATLACCIAMAASTSAFAQQQPADGYPNRPITIVVPSAPAGSTDIVARMVGEALGKQLNTPVVIDNRPGGSGNIGTDIVARAQPDGYTLLMQYSGYHVGNPALFSKVRWQPSDFAPVALVMRAPHVVAISDKIPADNLGELIAFGQKDSRGLFYASSGTGSIQHIAGAMFGRAASVPTHHVPYRGAGPVVADLVSGQVDMFVTTPPSVIGQIRSGNLKALAYTGPERHPQLGDVPTSAEAGLPDYEVESWFALFAPAKTPPAVIERLAREVQRIVESDDYRSKIEEQGAFARYLPPAELAAFVDTELQAWKSVIDAEGIKMD